MMTLLPVPVDDGRPNPLLPARHYAFINFLLIVILMIGGWVGIAPGMAAAEEGPVISYPDPKPEKNSTSPLKHLQRFISRADGDRCPMYPTCSQYASQAFAREGILMGWVLTSDRLLRCGRDETRLAKPIQVQKQKYAYDPLEANTFWWKER